MSGRNVYLLTYLPHLGNLGEAPPVSCAEFLSLLAEDENLARPLELTRAVLLGDDLLLRDAHLGGEIDPANEADPKLAEPVILTTGQLCDDEPLPEYLTAEGSTETTKIVTDVVWEAYFRHAHALANQLQSRFLIAWVGFEIALRNAVAQERAEALELEPGDYFVAEDIADTTIDLASTVNEWSAAPDPLAGQRVLDQARWAWLGENDAYFGYGDEELIAYGAKLMLQQRWGRLIELTETAEKK